MLNMEFIGIEKIKEFALTLDKPLYIVGGAVRNYLIDGNVSGDIDLCAPIDTDTFSKVLGDYGFLVIAEYRRTGTVLFSDGERKYEFTSFRTEKYKGGEHTPYSVELTEDIKLDALRRDFKCNAIYYNLKTEEIVDVLDGVCDIENKTIDTVTNSDRVFNNDGLRLMRLARFAGELGFSPKPQVIFGARNHVNNICDISVERIYAELKLILSADKKYPFSKKDGHCIGVKILQRIGFFEQIFHSEQIFTEEKYGKRKYEILRFAPIGTRLAVLMLGEDVGVVKTIFSNLRVDREEREKVLFILKHINYDENSKESESNLREFIVKNLGKNFYSLLSVKDAVYTANRKCRALCLSPEHVRWEKLINKMQNDGTPFNFEELKISAKELTDIGFKSEKIGIELKKLFNLAVKDPCKNDNKILTEIAKMDIKMNFNV